MSSTEFLTFSCLVLDVGFEGFEFAFNLTCSHFWVFLGKIFTIVPLEIADMMDSDNKSESESFIESIFVFMGLVVVICDVRVVELWVTCV